MAIDLYMDHNVPMAITNGLRLRGVNVITAFEDNSHQLDDPALLDRATTLGRVVFTRDDDFLSEAHRRQRTGVPFGGVIFAHQLKVSIGRCVHDLEVIAKVGEPEDMYNSVQHLPL
jgi:hypothetical protein